MSIEENLSRVYTINLGRAWITAEYKRTDRVINMIKEFAEKHMKTDEVKLDQDLNRQIWSRGKTNPPRKVRVKMVKDDDGVVTVSLYEEIEAATTEAKETEAKTEAPADEAKIAEEKTEEVKAEPKEETKANKTE